MIQMERKWLNLRELDELAGMDTAVHRLHPCAKLVTTVMFITVVASFSKYEIIRLLPLILYPWAVLRWGRLKLAPLLKRLLLVLPLSVCVGLFNPWLDHTVIGKWGGIVLRGGWLSLASIVLKFFLATGAALLLIATTRLDAVGRGLVLLKVPRMFVLQLLFMYRYVYVLAEEVLRLLQAYTLRSGDDKGLQRPVWGSLLGQLLLRTMERARRIYQAMLCRGFDGTFLPLTHQPFTRRDAAYCLVWAVWFGLVRCLPPAGELIRIIGRLGA